MLRRLSRRMTGVVKPLRDHREYKYFELESNRLRVFVASDASTDKAGACLDVNVGSYFDGRKFEGLAHFLEHMLFLGTRKFPDEAEYNNYLAKHGGYSNAYTSETDTVYFFSVGSSGLEDALDRFSQFFVSPLFTESATEREKEAVNSEHMKNVQEDAWRQHQLMKTLIFPEGHVAHHFSTGNAATLAHIPREVLLDFHGKFYSSNIMTLAVVGKESVEELEAMVRRLFQDVRNTDVTVPRGKQLVEGAGAEAEAVGVDGAIRRKLVYVVPVKEHTNKVQLDFYLPEQESLWRAKPAKFLSHILGHEAEGSVLAALKQRNIATDLSAGVSYDGAGVAVFRIDVHLSNEAVDSLAGEGGVVEEILEAVLKAAEIYRASKVREEQDHEMMKMDELNFKFKNCNDAVSLAQTLATNAQHIDVPEEILSAGELVTQYDAELVSSHFRLINADNVTVKVVSKRFAHLCDRTEPWYGTLYGVYDLNFARNAATGTAAQLVSLIPPNPFVPETTVVKQSAASAVSEEERTRKLWEAPSLALVNKVSLFFSADEDRFRLPKAAVGVALYPQFKLDGPVRTIAGAKAETPVSETAVRGAVAEILAQSVTEALNEKVGYQANMAGLKFSVRSGFTDGSAVFHLSFSGYAEKLDVLVAQVMQEFAATLREGVRSPQVLNTVVERITRNLQNQKFRKSYEEAVDQNNALLLSNYTALDERIAAVMFVASEVNSAGSQAGVLRSFADCDFAVESLVEGDMVEARVCEEFVAKAICGNLTVARPQKIELPSVMDLEASLPASSRGRGLVLARSVRNAEEVNSAVVTTVQLGRVAVNVWESDESELRTSALALLLNQAVSQWFFDELRTKQQLGYIVNAQNSIVGSLAVMKFVVQSSEKPAADLMRRVNTFIDEFVPPAIESLTDDEVAKYKAAVQKTLTEKPKNVNERFNLHWGEIVSRRFHFQRRLDLAQVVGVLSKADLINFANVNLSSGTRLHSLVRGCNDTLGDNLDVLSPHAVAQLKTAVSTVWLKNNEDQLDEHRST